MSADSAPLAGRREWIGLAVIALPCLLYSMDLTVLELAVPKLSADLEPTSSQLLWIMDIYGFLLAGFLITMRTLARIIHERFRRTTKEHAISSVRGAPRPDAAAPSLSVP